MSSTNPQKTHAFMLKSCIPIIFCFPRGYRGLHFSRFSPWISTDPLNSVHIHGSTSFSPVDIHGPSFFSLRGYPRFQKNFRPPYHDNNSTYPKWYLGRKKRGHRGYRGRKKRRRRGYRGRKNRGTVDTHGPPLASLAWRPVRIHGAPVLSVRDIHGADRFVRPRYPRCPPFYSVRDII